jgi:hypothetical protein
MAKIITEGTKVYRLVDRITGETIEDFANAIQLNSWFTKHWQKRYIIDYNNSTFKITKDGIWALGYDFIEYKLEFKEISRKTMEDVFEDKRIKESKKAKTNLTKIF